MTELPLVNADEIAESLNDQRSEVADYIQDPKSSDAITGNIQPVVSQVQSSPDSQKSGDIFNPEIHAVGKDGQPKLTKTGKFRRKRVVSVVGMPLKSGGVNQKPVPIVNGSLGSGEGQRKMAAKVATDATFSLGMLLGGAAAKPLVDAKIGIDEHQQLFFAWDNYLMAKNINDIPPGVALAIGLSGYGMRVMMLDATQQKTKSFWGKVKDKIVNVTAKRVYATQSVSGNDGKRKNDTSAADSSGADKAGDTGFSFNTTA